MEASAPPAAVRDPARLAALHDSALLDTPAEEAFDRLTRLAAHGLDLPVALVSLVDEDRQFFKSCIGLAEPWNSQRGTPLSHSFCQHAVATAEPLVIEDAREHPLVRDNLAIRDLDVIAYAGFPLTTSEGAVLGTFCAIDSKPRSWSDGDLAFVREMAESAMTEIELRNAVRQLEDARAEAEGTALTLRELQAISDAALVNLETDDLLRELIARVTTAVDADVAAILLEGEEGLSIRASSGLGEGDEEMLFAVGRTLVGDSAAGSTSVVLDEGRLDAAPGAIRTLVGVPFGFGGRSVGLLAVGTRAAGRGFTSDETTLLELAGERAGHGVYNARLYERALSSAELLERQLVATLQRQQADAEKAASERGRLLSHIVAVQEEERRRIALDVHDDYLQSLTAVRMQLERLRDELGSAPAQRDSAERLAEEVAATTERMRSLVFDLRPPALDWAGLASALRLYLEETKERFGLGYRLDTRFEEEPPGDVRLVLYRIAQEAITNVCKHAGASRVEVTLSSQDGGALVRVRDDGGGVEAAPGARSFGLASMRERAESAGGWWRIDSTPGAGTSVEFWVPFES